MVSDRTLVAVFGLRPAAVRLWGDAIRAASTMAVALVLAGLTIVYVETARNTITLRHFQDFGVFYDSTASVRAGGPLYGPPQVATAGAVPLLNLNPPHFHLAIWPFTFLSPARALVAWLAVSAISLAASLLIICRTLNLRGWSIVVLSGFVYASPATVATLLTGQVGLMLLLPFTLAWKAAREQRDAPAGGWLGLCASIKPPFLLFAPYFVIVQRWAATMWLAIVGAVVFVIGAAIFGLQAHRDWIANLTSVTWAEHYMNVSLLGLFERGLSTNEWQWRPVADWPSVVRPLWIVSAGLVGTATLWNVRRIADVDRQFLLITTASMLLSPVSWVYYLWFLIPPIAAMASGATAMKRGWRPALLSLALTGLLVPPWLPWTAIRWAGLATVTLGSIYCWALLALWFVTIADSRTHDAL